MSVRERTVASVVSMVPMGVLMKSTNNFTLWQVAPLRVVLEAMTSPATASVAAHGHVDSWRPRAHRKWDRGQRAGGGHRVDDPRASDRSALVQDRRIVSTSRSLHSSVLLIEIGHNNIWDSMLPYLDKQLDITFASLTQQILSNGHRMSLMQPYSLTLINT